MILPAGDIELPVHWSARTGSSNRAEMFMASLITHAAFGAAVGAMANRPLGLHGRKAVGLVVLLAACGVAPDLDVVTFRWVSYDHFVGHRGFLHSPFFYGVVATAAGMFWARLGESITELRGDRRHAIVFGLAVFSALLSHSLLDALTTGGEGVMLLFPFDAGRHFFPWRPIAVAPLDPANFWGPWGIRVLLSEAPWLIALSFVTVTVRLIQAQLKGRPAIE